MVTVREPGAFRHLPEPTRLWLVAKMLGPFGAWWLRPGVEGRVPVNLGHRPVSAARHGGCLQVEFETPTGGRRVGTFNHVMSATGYRPDVDRLDFLDSGLRHGIARTAGAWPALGPSFNSSVPGLYFSGLARDTRVHRPGAGRCPGPQIRWQPRGVWTRLATRDAAHEFPGSRH